MTYEYKGLEKVVIIISRKFKITVEKVIIQPF